MSQRQRQRQQGTRMNPLFGLAFLAIALFAVYFVFKSLFSILALLAPLLLIVTLIFNRQVVTNFFKGMFRDFKHNPLMGVLKGLFVFFGFPVFSAYMFGKAMLYRKMEGLHEQVRRKEEEGYADYEEVEPDIVENEDFLDLKDIDVQIEPELKEGNSYDDLFKG